MSQTQTGGSSASTASPPSSEPTPVSTSSSSQHSVSSFDTLPASSQDNTPPDAASKLDSWGRLYVLNDPDCRSYDLSKSEYIVGRFNACDIILNCNERPTENPKIWAACSKKHFKIYCHNKKDGRVVFLKDLSVNGTLVNERCIGKGNFVVIRSGDCIGLVKSSNKAFMYAPVSRGEETETPAEVREKYMFIKDIDRGACGKVKLTLRKSDGVSLACKLIKKASFRFLHSTKSKQAQREVAILSQLSHPCIVKMFEIIDTDKHLYMFMELVDGGNLFTTIKRNVRLDEDHAKSITYQIIRAVKYLHDNKVVHRDLKPENILLTTTNPDDQIIKVADFGVSKLIESKSMLRTLCGTPSYMAPEIISSNGEIPYTKAVDCWSIGVMLYVCITGQPAFTGQRPDTDLDMSQQIKEGNYVMKDKYWQHLLQAKNLVTRLLTVDVQARLTLEDALAHTWFQDELITTLDKRLEEEASRISSNAAREGSVEFSRPPAKKRRLDDLQNTRSGATTPVLSRRGLAELSSNSSENSSDNHRSSTKDSSSDGDKHFISKKDSGRTQETDPANS